MVKIPLKFSPSQKKNRYVRTAYFRLRCPLRVLKTFSFASYSATITIIIYTDGLTNSICSNNSVLKNNFMLNWCNRGSEVHAICDAINRLLLNQIA